MINRKVLFFSINGLIYFIFDKFLHFILTYNQRILTELSQLIPDAEMSRILNSVRRLA